MANGDTPQQLSPADFASKIKAKYPQYKSLPDDQLVSKVIAKYPTYKSQINFGTKPTTEQGKPLAAPQGGTSMRADTDTTGIKAALLDPFKALDVTKGIENYTEQGRQEHPILSRVGDVTRGAKELMFGGQEAGKPMGTRSGVANNPVTTAMSMAMGGSVSPVTKLAPNAERAGAAFQEVMGAAKTIPIDVAAPGDVALRADKLSRAGGRLPKVISDFIKRATDPNKPPITYEEARDFYSNATQLSVDETMKMKPVMKKQVAKFVNELGKSIEEAADEAGKFQQYKGAMKEYRQAKRLEELGRRAREWTLKGAFGAAGYYAVKDATGR